MRDGGFGRGGRGVEDVGCAAVGHDFGKEGVSLAWLERRRELIEEAGRGTLPVHGKVDVFDRAVCTEYFAQMAFVDVFREFFDYNLQSLSTSSQSSVPKQGSPSSSSAPHSLD